MDSGFVALWRKTLDSEVLYNPHLWQLFTWCLLRANHKKKTIPVTTGRGTTQVTLKPGQFIWGRNSCADVFGWSPSTANKRMKKLQEMGNVSVKSNTHYSVVTICKWGDYQFDGSKKEQPTIQPTIHPSDTQVTPKCHPSNTDNNDDNDNNEDNDKNTAYGVMENVILTAKEFSLMGEKMGEKARDDYINRLSTYEKIGNYKKHNMVIYKWWNKDGAVVQNYSKPTGVDHIEWMKD